MNCNACNSNSCIDGNTCNPIQILTSFACKIVLIVVLAATFTICSLHIAARCIELVRGHAADCGQCQVQSDGPVQ